MQTFILFLLLALSLPAQAAQHETVTRSAGKLVSDQSITLAQKLANSPQIRNQVDTTLKRQARSANHDSSVNFYIFDAWVTLSGDDDGDGYFHRITTTFDADVNTARETVYAKLYLSYQGGAWIQIADTELFEINYDSMSDSYEVETELLEGYATGDYDVLIELHSLYHSGVVASAVLYQDIEGYGISLEDRASDEWYPNDYAVTTTTTYVETGNGYLVTQEEYIAGSISWQGLLLLAVLLGIKWRNFTRARASGICLSKTPKSGNQRGRLTCRTSGSKVEIPIH